MKIQNSPLDDQVSIDIDALTLSLTEKLKQSRPISKEPCIHRVPHLLKVLDERSYTPQCVSIGPYHHGKHELQAMEEHKRMYLTHFLSYTNVRLKEFYACVKDNEARLRDCYQERIDLSSERFVTLVLVDAVFVIMVMLKSISPKFAAEDKLLFDKRRMLHDVSFDMLLLENQLPFFILDAVLLLSNIGVSLLQTCAAFINTFIKSWMVNSLDMSEFSECKHLVDFLRIGQQPLKVNKRKGLTVMNIPSVLELQQAGIKFKIGSSQILADIKFDFRDGILEIPQTKVTTRGQIFYRNIQAFEQLQFEGTERYFNDYISIMSLLLKNGKDVEILSKKGIIEDYLQDNEEVVHILKNINKGNILDPMSFYFADVVNDLNKYCSQRRNRWRASLIQNYFYSPGATISVIVATAVILLAVIQTICSILQVKQQQQQP